MRQKMLLLGAVLFGVIAFVLTYRQLEAERRSLREDMQTYVLVKLKTRKAPNEEIRLEDLARHEVQRRPAEMRMSRDIRWADVSHIIGRRLDVTVEANQVLLHTDLQPPSQRQGFSSIIRDEFRAVSISVDQVASINNLIQPNDSVDVIGTFRFPDVRGDSSLDTITLTVLQNVKVLAVGNRWGELPADAAGRVSYGTVTLLLYPEEVEMIVFASQKGRLSLSLRNYEDKRIERNIESRSVNFKLLEQEIPKYNEKRQQNRGH